MFKRTKLILRNEKGQGLVEYALILVLVAIVAITALTTMGKGVTNTLNTASGQLK